MKKSAGVPAFGGSLMPDIFIIKRIYESIILKVFRFYFLPGI